MNCKNGISSWEIHRSLEGHAEVGMVHVIGFVSHKGTIRLNKLGGPDSEVETDETFVGGARRTCTRTRKLRYEQRAAHKARLSSWACLIVIFARFAPRSFPM